ncbi:hypothetical protein OROGR_020836 [Orobanche gracilis]
MGDEGQMIEATFRKGLIKKFRPELAEGCVYKLIYFAIVLASRSYRASADDFKMVFDGMTRVVPYESLTIPLNVFSFMNSHEIALTLGESDFLAAESKEVGKKSPEIIVILEKGLPERLEDFREGFARKIGRF